MRRSPIYKLVRIHSDWKLEIDWVMLTSWFGLIRIHPDWVELKTYFVFFLFEITERRPIYKLVRIQSDWEYRRKSHWPAYLDSSGLKVGDLLSHVAKLVRINSNSPWLSQFKNLLRIISIWNYEKETNLHIGSNSFGLKVSEEIVLTSLFVFIRIESLILIESCWQVGSD